MESFIERFLAKKSEVGQKTGPTFPGRWVNLHHQEKWSKASPLTASVPGLGLLQETEKGGMLK